jgi:thiamine pyrophosphate-dependent acetolactate synthase large subunit-like protein
MRQQRELRRRPLVARMLTVRGDALVIAGLGSPAYDCAAAGDHPLNVYLWGAMGSAATVGLGLALAQPARRVLVITGDGELLMGLGALATIAAKAPENLAVAVLDNERYGETGMQRSHTSAGVDLAGVARSAGFAATATVRQEAELEDAIATLYTTKGPALVVFKVASVRDPLVLPPWDGPFLKHRFREALLGSPYPPCA